MSGFGSEFQPERQGKSLMSATFRDEKLAQGMHVHTNRADGNTVCEGGDSACALFGIQLIEAMETWS